MNTISFQHGFIDKLVESTSFRRWFRLNAFHETRVQWFSDFINADEEIIDDICCGVMLTMFRLMEKALIADDDSSYEWLFCRYLLGEDFKKLIDTTLPEN